MGFERKSDHVEICLNEEVNASVNYWNDVHLVHKALPEINLNDIDTSITLFDKKLSAPIVISAITGGFKDAEDINRNLASGASKTGIGLGVGSQRPALVDEKFSRSYEVIKEFDVPLVIANIGAPQLITQEDGGPFTIDDCKRAIQMVDGDILAIHMNFLQEIIQPEGDIKAKGCIDAIGRVAKELPVIAKETGAGISRDVALTLKDKGVVALDVGGLGGTSFAAVEHHRANIKKEDVRARLGETFWNWGIPTPISLVMADVGLPMIATGGLRTGLDVARSISLGATAGGLARRILAAATEGPEKVEKELRFLISELKGAMFLVGASNVRELMDAPVVVTGQTADWLNAMEPTE
jgi:isopentenyl-diphosphate delta-isomerase